MKSQITKSIIVNGEVPVLYDAWRNFENHPQFMEQITAVTTDGPDTNRWVMEGPLNSRFEWTTKTTRLEPNRRVAWKTIDGDVKTSGQVTFTELPQGQAEVTVTFQTIPPDNLTERVAAELFENGDTQLEKDLRSFKAFI
ncbi:MAG: SRPBCC family protein, partial [Gammaproteobacteria bacterium]|nr:SRPBCC family protein [Gammaproteobacteria bacterium]